MRVLVCLLSVGPLACSSPPTQSTTVSFRTDVIPVFVASCAFDGCHNDPSAQTLPFLAIRQDGGAPAFAQQAYDALVGKPTVEDPTMPFATPGDPSKSFLMRKMDDDLVGLESQCARNNRLQIQNQTTSACGVSMPSQLPILDANRRDTVRTWIQQGAKNN